MIKLPKMPEINIDNISKYFQDMEDYRAEIIEIAKNNSRKGCISVRTNDSKYKLLSKDILSNNWRLTYYDENGWPTNHETNSKWDELAYDILIGSVEFANIPIPQASMDNKETIIQRIKYGMNMKFDIVELITFHRIFPHEYM